MYFEGNTSNIPLPCVTYFGNPQLNKYGSSLGYNFQLPEESFVQTIQEKDIKAIKMSKHQSVQKGEKCFGTKCGN